jgi:hypothetical protein
VEAAVIEGAVQRLRPKLMTVTSRIGESRANSVGNGHWIGCYEAHRRAHCRWDDHLNHSLADFGSDFLLHDEEAHDF